MTRVQAVGVVLIALGLVYALMYAGWLRRARRNPSAAVAISPTPSSATPHSATLSSATSRSPTPSSPILTESIVVSEGTYISTTLASSRLERVAAAGLGVRARATMRVDATSVCWDREGADDLRIESIRLLRVSLERGMAGKFVGQARIVVVSWHTEGGDRYATGFLPRRRAESAALVQAVQDLIQAQPTPDGTP